MRMRIVRAVLDSAVGETRTWDDPLSLTLKHLNALGRVTNSDDDHDND